MTAEIGGPRSQTRHLTTPNINSTVKDTTKEVVYANRTPSSKMCQTKPTLGVNGDDVIISVGR